MNTTSSATDVQNIALPPAATPADQGQSSTPNPPGPLPVVPVAPAPSRRIRRNGRIARLPKLQRDMVNRMLWNGIPYKNIVAALEEDGFTVTQRNISNWATGGYLEWSLAQEHLLQHRLDQDQLLDSLRRDDASELSEVGLQAAATRLSQIMLQKALQGETADLDVDKVAKLVDLLCRLNRELVPLQKQRDDSRRSLGRDYDPARVKDQEKVSAIETERFFSDPPPDSGFSQPSEPPVLPPVPTATLLARQADEDHHNDQLQQWGRLNALLQGSANRNPTPTQPRPQNPPSPPPTPPSSEGVR